MKAIGKLCSEFSDFLFAFDKLPFDETARQTHFVKRKPKKITPRNFLLGLIQSVLGDGKALRNIAIHIGAQIDDTVAKQSVDERITDKCLDFLETTLLQALLQRCQSKREWIKNTALAQHFRRVLVQDSTTIALPPKLVADFPGPRNKFGQHACAKIQAIIDLLREQYCAFELSPYTKNDQAAAHDIFATARAGDLVLRDLGYFALAVLKQMLEKGIYFLSRFRYGIAIFEADGETPFNLLKALRQSDVLDQIVRIGATEKSACASHCAAGFSRSRCGASAQGSRRSGSPQKSQCRIFQTPGLGYFCDQYPLDDLDGATSYPNSSVALACRDRVQIVEKPIRDESRSTSKRQSHAHQSPCLRGFDLYHVVSPQSLCEAVEAQEECQATGNQPAEIFTICQRVCSVSRHAAR